MALEHPTSEESEKYIDEPEFNVGKKTLKVVRIPGTHLYRVKPTSGGSLPMYLSGRFTSATEAEKLVNRYIKERGPGDSHVRSARKTKEVTDGES
ncbi:hypothetical protein GWO18_03525 [Candidatus Bathyarchaeota archaeon]|nr:hypothetical protein [Candidatus Bathyarchaeota archaeon]